MAGHPILDSATGSSASGWPHAGLVPLPASAPSGTQSLLAAVYDACAALAGAPDSIRAITVHGCLPAGSTALPLMARSESLAGEFHFDLLLHLAADGYELRFSRPTAG